MRVLVVGAGPTGLTAGVELLRRGIDVDVIDRRKGGSALSRAVGITPRSLKLLEPSGVARMLTAEGMPFRGVKIYNGGAPFVSFPIQVSRSRFGYDFVLGLAQDRTEHHLCAALQELGGKVSFGLELTGFSQNNNKVRASINGKQRRVEYDYLIGADGVRSTVREALRLPFHGHDLPETWSIADVESEDWPNRNIFTICRLGAGKVIVVVPLEAARYRLVSNTENALASLPVPMTAGKVRREGTFTISVRQVERYQVGRVFLAGDAAHCHSPIGGRGMNLGIADAADLAARLADGDVEGYTEARHPDAAAVIDGSERARRIITSPNGTMQALVSAAFWTISKTPALRRRLSELVLYG